VTVVDFASILRWIRAARLDHHRIHGSIPLEFEAVLAFHRLVIVSRSVRLQVICDNVIGHFLEIIGYFVVVIFVDLVAVR
jgi:hypothetical protein